jgi:hypothetical protein
VNEASCFQMIITLPSLLFFTTRNATSTSDVPKQFPSARVFAVSLASDKVR